MTDAKLSALEAAAKAATPGPWEQCESDKEFVNLNDHFICGCNTMIKDIEINGKRNAAYIAAANPAAVLELIAELRQAKEECLHHKDYIAELEQSSLVYDKRLADISKLLDIEHEDGSYAELSYIYHSVKRLQGELRQARAERDWIAGHCDGVPCNGASCPYPPSKEMGRCIRTPQRQCWLDAAKEATCPKN